MFILPTAFESTKNIIRFPMSLADAFCLFLLCVQVNIKLILNWYMPQCAPYLIGSVAESKNFSLWCNLDRTSLGHFYSFQKVVVSARIMIYKWTYFLDLSLSECNKPWDIEILIFHSFSFLHTYFKTIKGKYFITLYCISF